MSTHPCDCAAATEGAWTDIHAYGCAIFKCVGCGERAIVSPPGGEPTYCTECCPDHEYEREPGEGWRCKTCFAEPPHGRGLRNV
jgi:hypothetical protein